VSHGMMGSSDPSHPVWTRFAAHSMVPKSNPGLEQRDWNRTVQSNDFIGRVRRPAFRGFDVGIPSRRLTGVLESCRWSIRTRCHVVEFRRVNYGRWPPTRWCRAAQTAAGRRFCMRAALARAALKQDDAVAALPPMRSSALEATTRIVSDQRTNPPDRDPARKCLSAHQRRPFEPIRRRHSPPEAGRIVRRLQADPDIEDACAVSVGGKNPTAFGRDFRPFGIGSEDGSTKTRDHFRVRGTTMAIGS